MKINITKEKIQYIFMITTLAILVAIIAIIVFFVVQDRIKMQSYRNDPTKKVLIDKIDHSLSINKDKRTFDDSLDLGNSYYELGEIDKSITAFLDMLKKYPRETLVYNNLANDYIKLKDYKNAQTYLLKSIEINYQQYRLYNRSRRFI